VVTAVKLNEIICGYRGFEVSANAHRQIVILKKLNRQIKVMPVVFTYSIGLDNAPLFRADLGEWRGRSL
jgi:hypothetical protein